MRERQRAQEQAGVEASAGVAPVPGSRGSRPRASTPTPWCACSGGVWVLIVGQLVVPDVLLLRESLYW